MKSNVKKLLHTLPFCIPFPFVFFAADYYLTNEQTWIAISVASFFGVLAFGYASMSKFTEMFAGTAVGAVISVIVTLALKGSLNTGWFAPLTPMLYIILLVAAVVLIELVIMFLVKILKKIKNKIKKT